MDNKQEIDKILTEIQADAKVQQMKQFIQHGNVSTYEHCESVARLSYSIDRRLSLHSDLKVLLTGAMLHDFYLTTGTKTATDHIDFMDLRMRRGRAITQKSVFPSMRKPAMLFIPICGL
jgi:hypothetical protein